MSSGGIPYHQPLPSFPHPSADGDERVGARGRAVAQRAWPAATESAAQMSHLRGGHARRAPPFRVVVLSRSGMLPRCRRGDEMVGAVLSLRECSCCCCLTSWMTGPGSGKAPIYEESAIAPG